MFSTICDVSQSIVDFFRGIVNTIGTDTLFFIALAVEALLVIFFLVKSLFSYEAALNRSLEKINYWLFEKKVVTEDNIKELNMLFKTKAPKRLCYHWQQYILFREGPPSKYLSTENLVDKPLKTSSYNSNIKNLTLFSTIWALIVGMFMIVAYAVSTFTAEAAIIGLLIPIFVMVIAIIFVAYLRARKNAILNALYQNCALFGRFMDNACIDLPTYIDYQILFSPQEIEQGQPVLREFLDYKARKEKEEFNRAKEEEVEHEEFDFSSTGIDGSLVLERAMKECETFLKKKERILLKISQLESELDTRRKNFDNVQKDYQTKIQASKENVERLRQMQEETTNRIESNYYRKQQTSEIGKQEQFEEEFEQQRAKYLLEKNEGEGEIAKLNAQLESERANVENSMLSEYQTFFNKFCQSAEKVVAKAFGDKFSTLKEENEQNKQYITELEIKLKNKNVDQKASDSEEGKYDENGNYVYPNGTFFDKDGNFHDEKGNIYSQDGKLIVKAPEPEQPQEPEEKQIVNFDDFDAFDFMTDTSQKGDVYDVAESVVNDLDKNIEVVNNSQKNDIFANREQTEPTPEVTDIQETEQTQQPEQVEVEQPLQQKAPAKKKGRPRKIVNEPVKPAKKRGRPRKVVEQKAEEKSENVQPKRKVGRPRKIVKTEPTQKRGRGRPRKNADIEEINKKLSEEEKRINEFRASINQDIENAMNNIKASEQNNKAAQREKLVNEIESLQKEAQHVMAEDESESRMAEINSKLESLLEEVKKLNS